MERLERIERYVRQFTENDLKHYFEVMHSITERAMNNGEIAEMLYGKLIELGGDYAVLSPAIWARVYPQDEFNTVKPYKKIRTFKFVDSPRDLAKNLRRGGKAIILLDSIRDINELDSLDFPIKWGLRENKLP